MKKTVGYAATVFALITAVVAFSSDAVWAGVLAVLTAALAGYATIASNPK